MLLNCLYMLFCHQERTESFWLVTTATVERTQLWWTAIVHPLTMAACLPHQLHSIRCFEHVAIANYGKPRHRLHQLLYCLPVGWGTVLLISSTGMQYKACCPCISCSNARLHVGCSWQQQASAERMPCTLCLLCRGMCSSTCRHQGAVTGSSCCSHSQHLAFWHATLRQPCSCKPSAPHMPRGHWRSNT